MRLHEDIHNYYEKIVLEEIIKRKLNEQYSEDVMADFCCTVLNQLATSLHSLRRRYGILFTTNRAPTHGRARANSYKCCHQPNIKKERVT